jgi:hypothetical protein
MCFLPSQDAYNQDLVWVYGILWLNASVVDTVYVSLPWWNTLSIRSERPSRGAPSRDAFIHQFILLHPASSASFAIPSSFKTLPSPTKQCHQSVNPQNVKHHQHLPLRHLSHHHNHHPRRSRGPPRRYTSGRRGGQRGLVRGEEQLKNPPLNK